MPLSKKLINIIRKQVTTSSASSGFTLLELLVVISIITLLSSITLVNVVEARRSARDARRISDIKALLLAFQDYYIDNSKWPNIRSSINSPENTYPGTTVQICQPLDSEGSFCQSQRVACCSAALGHPCPVNYWFPSIDNNNTYFPSGAPHDPLERSSCIVQNNPQYSYNYFVNNVGGPDDFRLVYFLERSRSYALGKLTASPCGASVPCQYQIAGYPGGYIDVNP